MVFKNTSELIHEALKITLPSWDKERIEKLYRGEVPTSMKGIVNAIQVDCPTFTLKHLNALFEHYSIPKWTLEESRKANRARPISEDSVKRRIKSLEEYGVTIERIQSLYAAGSEKDICDALNREMGVNLLSKRWLSAIFELYGVEKRSKTEAEQLRQENIKRTYKNIQEKQKVFGRGFTAEEIVSLYSEGESINFIVDKTGASAAIIKRTLQKNNIPIRKQIELPEIISKLQAVGIDRKFLEKYYLEKGCSQSDLRSKLKEISDLNISVKMMSKILAHYSIQKTEAQIRRSQGARSRAARDESFRKLSETGYSLKDLASEYSSNKKKTWSSLSEELNKQLGEVFFTPKWLERNISPHLSEDRLRGTSRVEKNFGEWLTSITSPPPETSKRSLIAPYELDFYIAELKVAIEFNGDYWHSDKFLLKNHGLTSEEYHTMKAERCAELDIQLLFVWESDWMNKQEDCKKAIALFFEKGIVLPILARS